MTEELKLYRLCEHGYDSLEDYGYFRSVEEAVAMFVLYIKESTSIIGKDSNYSISVLSPPKQVMDIKQTIPCVLVAEIKDGKVKLVEGD